MEVILLAYYTEHNKQLHVNNPRPGTMLSERDVHSSFHCSQPFCSPFRCSWWFGPIPRTRLQLGNRAFWVAGQVAWNNMPLDIRSAPTSSTFKNMLNTGTHLFSRSYLT